MHPVLEVMLPPQKFDLPQMLFTVLMLCLVFAITFLAMRFRSGGFSLSGLAVMLKPVQPSAPVVAYKKAALATDGFYGVGAYRHYSTDADAEDLAMGFHAYESPDEAQAHEQGGDVVLEVLLSGKIRAHAKGFVASHQRVLQLFPTSCSYCTSTHVVAFAPRGDTCVFLCDAHAYVRGDAYRDPMGIWNFGASPQLEPALSEQRPLEELPEVYPFLRAANIVVASFSAKTPESAPSWIPTVPLTEEESS